VELEEKKDTKKPNKYKQKKPKHVDLPRWPSEHRLKKPRRIGLSFQPGAWAYFCFF